MRSQSPISTDIQTGITPPESLAQEFFQASSSLEERQETATHSDTVRSEYGDTVAIARWIEGAQISRFYTLSPTLDLPDLAVEMNKAFKKICQTDQKAFSTPSSSITAYTTVVQLPVDSTNSAILSTSSMPVSDMEPQSIGVEQRGRRFVWSRFSR